MDFYTAGAYTIATTTLNLASEVKSFGEKLTNKRYSKLFEIIHMVS